MAADQPIPRFEPPPWEQEAFDRFRKEQEEARAKDELNAALRAVREEPADVPAKPVDATPAEAEAAEVPGFPQPPVDEGPPAVLPEAKVESMLIQLRGEEKPTHPVNMVVVNSVMGFMAAVGVYILIRSLVLLGDIRAAAPENMLLAVTISFVVFLTGCAFIGGAYFLYRKYHT
ncbi:MAG: hypothetical protein Q7W51_01015 [Coriobacteriia bacterium]|nr:hypothetical protein [Coriobacteriia bacterium]